MGGAIAIGHNRALRLECFALHISRDRNTELLEDGWSHIHQLQPAQLTSARTFMRIGVVLDDDTELCMITIIRTSVVIECIYRAVTYGAYRAPEKITKVDNEVRWNAIYFLVNFFWFEDFCADIYTVVVHKS